MKKKKGSKCDPLGSYTGVTIDGETPTQDADDLWKKDKASFFLYYAFGSYKIIPASLWNLLDYGVIACSVEYIIIS